jgi:hypothetical protein
MRRTGRFVLLAFTASIGTAALSPAQAGRVVLDQKFTIAPFAIAAGAKLSGDRVCKYFLLTHYGDPKMPAWLGFNHDGKAGETESESVELKDVKIVSEDVAVPYATRLDNGSTLTWTIHISPADYQTEEQCLGDITLSK